MYPLEDLLIPKLFGKLYETIKDSSTYGNPLNFVDNLKKMNTPGLMLLVVIIYIVVLAGDFIKYNIESSIIPGYLKYLRGLIFEGTVNKNQEDYKDVKSGEYMSKVLELTRSLRDIFQYTVSQFLPNISSVIIIIIYLGYKIPELLPVLIMSVIVVVLLSIYSCEHIMTLTREREHFFISELAESINDKMQNMMNIVTNNEGTNVIKENVVLEQKNADMMKGIIITESTYSSIIHLFTLFTYAFCLFILYKMRVINRITGSDMIAYMLTMGKFLTSMHHVNWSIIFMLSFRIGIVTSHREYLEDIFKYTDMKKTNVEFKDNSITIKGLKYKYDESNEHYLFDNLNMKISHNEKIGVVGRAGSGKTTLMRILVGLHTPSEGEIIVGQQNISKISKKDLRDQVNYVNQRTAMFNGDVIHNMQYANDKTEAEIVALLERYQLTTLFSQLEKGVHNDVGVNGGKLSGGMQKVTMLVRGICRSGNIVIFDEPLASIDEQTGDKVMKMILNECKDKTLIIITHDKKILPYMDRVININEFQKNK
jgi:ABC-type multidrug transport system fused ATPase/permease subunit